jgi:hypothetical protein
LPEALNAPCGTDGIPIIERRGCGRVELSWFGGFTSWTSLFDERTGALLGRKVGDDTEVGVCNLFEYEFGEGFDCPEVSECTHCSGFNGSTPPRACAP